MELKDLRKNYDSLRKKYNLPGFEELDETFEIGKVERESQTLLRVVRKAMMERIVSLLGFIEMLLNPMNAPRVYHSYLKTMTVEDKQRLETIYSKFTELSLCSLEREIDYSEKEEANLIKKILATWLEMKPLFKIILANLKQPVVEVQKKERSYFG